MGSEMCIRDRANTSSNFSSEFGIVLSLDVSIKMKLKLICFNSNRGFSAIVFSEASKVYCKMLSRFKALSTLNVMRLRIVVKN